MQEKPVCFAAKTLPTAWWKKITRPWDETFSLLREAQLAQLHQDSPRVVEVVHEIIRLIWALELLPTDLELLPTDDEHVWEEAPFRHVIRELDRSLRLTPQSRWTDVDTGAILSITAALLQWERETRP